MAKATPGIRVRHSRGCATADAGASCRCGPSFEAWVFSKRDGKKIRKTFPTLAAAKGWRADALGAVRRNKLQPAPRVTVEQAAKEWLEKAERGEVRNRSGRPYKPSAIRGYRADLERYVLPDFGAVPLTELHRRDVQALVDRLVAAGLSGSKVRNAIMPLRVVYRRAFEDDLVTLNPTEKLRLPELGDARGRVAAPEVAATLLEALPEQDRALWATAFYASLRRGELRGLEWPDVDFDANVIHVRRGWDNYAGAIDPKSRKGARKVPMAETLRKHLLEHQLRTGRRAGLVFGRTARAPFTPTHVRKRALEAWAAAAVAAFVARQALPVELAAIGLHECRHTYVSIMHAAGFTLEEIGDYVGHSSAYMTDRYRHLLEGHEQRAAARLEAFLATSGGR